MEPPPRTGHALSRGLRRLDAMLGIEPGSRGERIWAVPVAVLVGTVAGFLLIGHVTSAPLVVSLPNGIVIALVMAGLSVACIPTSAERDDDEQPPDDRDDTPVLGSPGGPWVLVAHLTPPPLETVGADDREVRAGR
jgi:hypothetical protein